MARIPRQDSIGSLHHVMNRAVGRRTLFEGGADIQEFLNCMIRSVDRGEIRVHAFSFLTTHFHLLVESVVGRIGDAFRCIESEYVRHFNRRRDRDGPLVRGRFFSKLIKHSAYWARVIRYIDDNAVDAGLVVSAMDYPYGSAACYAQLSGPDWLERKAVEKYVRAVRGLAVYDPQQYMRAFPSGMAPSEREWVQRRLEGGDRYPDSFGDLLCAAPGAVREILTRRTLVADGTRPGVPLIDPASVMTAVAGAAATSGPWVIRNSRRTHNAWDVLATGLLRILCADGLEAISIRSGRSTTTVRTHLRMHKALMTHCEEYGERAREVAQLAIQVFSAGLCLDGVPLPDLGVLLTSP
jgi:hypothetical protein